MEKYIPHLGHFSIIEACNQPGCPICTIRKNAVSAYLQAILSHYVDDPDMRERLCHAWGYCHAHAWMLSTVERGNLLTVAVMYQDIFEKGIAQALTRPKSRLRSHVFSNLTRRLFKGKQRAASDQSLHLRDYCPACDVEHEVETTALQIMLKALAKGDREMQEALKNSDGICLPHVNLALETAHTTTARDALLDLTQKKLTQIQEELGEFIRKHDYRFQHEPVGEEKWGWKRAISLIVGSSQ